MWKDEERWREWEEKHSERKGGKRNRRRRRRRFRTEFILTETGNYSVEINVTTTSGNIISIDKGSQEVEKIIETEVPTVEEESSIGILGWIAIISTILLVPMFIATLISKLKRR